MELTLQRETLAEAVSWSSRSIPPRPAVPVLGGVRITATETDVEFASFDYEVSSRVTVAASSVSQPGAVVVDGKLLSDTARMLPGSQEQVTLRTENNYLHIICGSFEQNMLVMQAEDYPKLPEFPPVVGSLSVNEFSHAVSQVAVAASRDETLPLLTGISVEVRPDKLCLLATDRYRMAMKEMEWHSVDSQSVDLVVKAKNLSDATKNIASGADIELAATSGEGSANLVGLSAGGRIFTSQVNDGSYPDVRRLFPDPVNITAVVRVDRFIETARRVALVSANQSNQQIFLSFTQGNLEFTAGTGGENTSQDSIEAVLNGADISVSFNSRLLLEGMMALDYPYARLSFKDEAKPVVITGQEKETGEDDTSYRYLIMPIRSSL